MQILQIMIGLSIFGLIATQAVPTFEAASDRSHQRILLSEIQAAIRHGMVASRATQQSVDIVLPTIPMAHRIHTLAGASIRAYPDGTVSPGEVRLCSENGLTNRLIISSLGRTRRDMDRSACD
jgi:hypothetical protein